MRSAYLPLALSLAVVASGGLFIEDDAEIVVASSLPPETIEQINEECIQGSRAITGADPWFVN